MPAARILVVDDHESIRRLLATILKKKGYVVETAGDGNQALKVFRTFRPHALLLDVMMPGENGYRVSRMIKMLGSLGDGVMVPKILLITGRHVEDVERAESILAFSMADDIIYKPFKPDDVLAKVRALLGIHATSPDPAR